MNNFEGPETTTQTSLACLSALDFEPVAFSLQDWVHSCLLGFIGVHFSGSLYHLDDSPTYVDHYKSKVLSLKNRGSLALGQAVASAVLELQDLNGLGFRMCGGGLQSGCSVCKAGMGQCGSRSTSPQDPEDLSARQTRHWMFEAVSCT